MSNPRTANGARRRALRKRLMAERRPCHLCGDPIDYSLPAGHPDCFEVDEIIPVSRYREGGYESATQAALDYDNLGASHRRCNQERGNMLVREYVRKKKREKRKKRKTAIVHTREW